MVYNASLASCLFINKGIRYEADDVAKGPDYAYGGDPRVANLVIKT